MAGRHNRKARGGGMKEPRKAAGGEHEFTPGAVENKEAEDKKEEGFSRGGRKRRAGGRVHGKEAAKRLDRKPRKSGGRVMAAGGSVMSGAANITAAKQGSKGEVDREAD